MNIVLFGCKDTTLQVAKFLIKNEIAIHLVTISPELANKNDVAGYVDLIKFSEYFVSIYVAESYNLNSSADQEFFNSNENYRLGFCVGWQRLIPNYVLKKFKNGVHGMHGSARDLPFGKGRSPMNWAIIEGRHFFTTNLFRYMDGVDNGPIVAKSCFSINSSDTAETLHYKNALSMCHIIKDNLNSLLLGNFNYSHQDTTEGESFYPKRIPSDGLIDWRDDIHNIDRLIRAVAPPFHGAIGLIDGAKVKIIRASIFYTDIELHSFFDAKIGEVLEIFSNGKFLVRCSGGVLLIHEFCGPKFSVGGLFDRVESPFSRFQRNTYGFFDI
jgi:methionyl-tRNA formyltransferase